MGNIGATSPAQPFFLPGSAGSRFAVYYPPALNTEQPLNILYIPPFAEEMNRSRSMVATQARSLADNGFGVLVLDLYGTGDSMGDFDDASLTQWLSDLDDAADWLVKQRPVCELWLWGLRMGGLIGLNWAATRQKRYVVKKILVWQPSFDALMELQQFLRLRIAANLFNGERKETVAILQQQLEAGDSIAVGGYCLSSELYRGLMSLSLDVCLDMPSLEISVFEISEDDGHSHQIQAWMQKIEPLMHINHQLIAGDRFWALDEHQSNLALIDVTTQQALSML